MDNCLKSTFKVVLFKKLACSQIPADERPRFANPRELLLGLFIEVPIYYIVLILCRIRSHLESDIQRHQKTIIKVGVISQRQIDFELVDIETSAQRKIADI
jgi:hypothetical protein